MIGDQWVDDDLPDGTEGDDIPPFAGWIILGVLGLIAIAGSVGIWVTT